MPFTVMLFLFLSSAGAGQAPANSSASAHSQTTLFVDCQDGIPKRIFSPLSFSEDQMWRARVEVSVRGDRGCLYTTRLWVAKVKEAYKLVYLMPPQREAAGNGMEILGWARRSRILLARAEEWPVGSDAAGTQRVLAIDADSGMVYEPNLEHVLDGRKDKQCMFRVTDAGFRAGETEDILVRAKFSTFADEGDTEEEVPPEKRCEKTEETWSFSFVTGEIKRLSNSEPLQLFKKFASNPSAH